MNKVDKAQATATAAQKQAAQADSNALDALDVASAAQSTANDASTTAGRALATTNAAHTTANSAFDTATTAKTTAETAKVTAGEAKTVANGKMDANNPTGTGALSIGRKADTTIGENSFALGNDVIASGRGSNAEGGSTIASGSYAHAEGWGTQSQGSYAHAEGWYSQAEGAYAHAEGEFTVAAGVCQHVQGKFNKRDTANRYAHIVGNGTGSTDDKRSNAHTLDWDGNAWFAGSMEGTAVILKSTTDGSENRITITADDNLKLTATDETGNSAEIGGSGGGEDGSGVKTVNGIAPDEDGNVAISIEDTTARTAAEKAQTAATEIKTAGADWSQNDATALDYIKNRTHYEVPIKSAKWGNGDNITRNTTSGDSYYLFAGNTDIPTKTDIVGAKVTMGGSVYTISADDLIEGYYGDTIYACKYLPNTSYTELAGLVSFIVATQGNVSTSFNNSGITWNITLPKAGVYFMAQMESIEWGGEIVKLDEKYLPESVTAVTLESTTSGSTKRFRITVDDEGVLSATEVTDS